MSITILQALFGEVSIQGGQEGIALQVTDVGNWVLTGMEITSDGVNGVTSPGSAWAWWGQFSCGGVVFWTIGQLGLLGNPPAVNLGNRNWPDALVLSRGNAIFFTPQQITNITNFNIDVGIVGTSVP
jgi:hypothetical protein